MNKFRKNPDEYLMAGHLSPAEILALKNGIGWEVRVRAQSTESDDPTQQFNRFGDSALVISVHPTVEIHLPKDNVTVGGPDALFIDRDGLVYRGVPET